MTHPHEAETAGDERGLMPFKLRQLGNRLRDEEAMGDACNFLHRVAAELAADPELLAWRAAAQREPVAWQGERFSDSPSPRWHWTLFETDPRRTLGPTLVRNVSPLYTPPSAPETREAVIEATGHHKLDNDRQVFFYEQDFYVLSNFSAFKVRWHGKWFDSSEQAYHWAKFGTGFALTSADGVEAERVEAQILKAKSAHDAFKIAEANKHLRRPDWDAVKVDMMRSILQQKVRQHEYVRRKLLATGDRELIEDSWRDDFWGWGQNRDGQNMLGKLWMEVRAVLQVASPQSPETGK